MREHRRKTGLEGGLDAALAGSYAAELAALAEPAAPPPELVARALASRALAERGAPARAARAEGRKPERAAGRRSESGAPSAEPLKIVLALAASLAIGLSFPWTARLPSPLAADIAAAWDDPVASGLRSGFLAPLIHDLASRNAILRTATKP